MGRAHLPQRASRVGRAYQHGAQHGCRARLTQPSPGCIPNDGTLLTCCDRIALQAETVDVDAEPDQTTPEDNDVHEVPPPKRITYTAEMDKILLTQVSSMGPAAFGLGRKIKCAWSNPEDGIVPLIVTTSAFSKYKSLLMPYDMKFQSVKNHVHDILGKNANEFSRAPRQGDKEETFTELKQLIVEVGEAKAEADRAAASKAQDKDDKEALDERGGRLRDEHVRSTYGGVNTAAFTGSREQRRRARQEEEARGGEHESDDDSDGGGGGSARGGNARGSDGGAHGQQGGKSPEPTGSGKHHKRHRKRSASPAGTKGGVRMTPSEFVEAHPRMAKRYKSESEVIEDPPKGWTVVTEDGVDYLVKKASGTDAINSSREKMDDLISWRKVTHTAAPAPASLHLMCIPCGGRARARKR